jgi:DNA polymerase-3 subunit epsilon
MFVVTDVETTGVSVESERIVEIAAARLEPDGHGSAEVTGRFSSLVDPGRSIPARATQVHGITTGMVYDAPPEAEVLPRFREFLGDGVFTAHNLTFDEGFLRAALERQALPDLENDTLCTLRLARRLLPGLGSHKLGTLARFYELSAKGQHRAAGDVEITATVLQKFLRQLAFEHDVEQVEDVLSFQHKNYRQVRKPPKALRRLRAEVLPQVPHAPGVYFLKNKSGTTCYIGKARDLRRRVGSHFSGVESASKRQRRLVKATRDIEWKKTPGELDALLLESRRIKDEKPRFNRAGRRYRSRPFLRLDRSADFPRLSWRYRLDTEEDGEAEYFGPLRNREEAEELVETLGRFFRLRECEDERLRRGERCLHADIDRCPAPCENGHTPGGRSAYADAVAELRAFLCGRDDAALEKAEAKMQAASEQHDYERAAEERDALQRLERFFYRQERVGGPIRQYDAVLGMPRSEERAAALHVVRHGLHAATLTLEDARSPEARADVEAALAEHFDEDAASPSAFTKREAHEARLLQQWTYRRRADLGQVRWNGEALGALAGRVAKQLGNARKPVAAD